MGYCGWLCSHPALPAAKQVLDRSPLAAQWYDARGLLLLEGEHALRPQPMEELLHNLWGMPEEQVRRGSGGFQCLRALGWGDGWRASVCLCDRSVGISCSSPPRLASSSGGDEQLLLTELFVSLLLCTLLRLQPLPKPGGFPLVPAPHAMVWPQEAGHHPTSCFFPCCCCRCTGRGLCLLPEPHAAV